MYELTHYFFKKPHWLQPYSDEADTLNRREGVLEVKEEPAAAVYSCIIIPPEKRSKQLILPCKTLSLT